jgi:hypothetical protein
MRDDPVQDHVRALRLSVLSVNAARAAYVAAVTFGSHWDAHHGCSEYVDEVVRTAGAAVAAAEAANTACAQDYTY